MSIKQRKKQDCNQYLDKWADYKKQLDNKEVSATVELKKHVESMLQARKNLDKTLAIDSLQKKIAEAQKIISEQNSLVSKISDKNNKIVIWPIITSVMVAVILAYGILGYDPTK